MANIKYKNEDILKGYVALCYKLGRVATKEDINKCEELPHSWTIVNRFGSIQEFQNQSGILKNNELSGKLLKEEVEKLLMKKRIIKARRLDYMEIRVDVELPSIEYIRRVYNNKVLDEIWDEVEGRIPKGIAAYLGL